jgi:tripartite-type tricarboxylate transporter receptor subunit TctC
VVAPRLAEALGQPVVIDNRGGAAGTIGTDLAAKARPDGYTLLLGNVGPLAVSPALNPRLPYDPVRDLAPITHVASFPNLLVVHPSLPVRTVKDLVALARARPGQLSYGSAGSGTSTHLAGELLKAVSGADIVHVPYKGGAAALTDVVGGQVAFYFGSLPSSLPLANAGRLRPVAVTSLERSVAAPAVPTVAESGYPGFETSAWYGILVPAGVAPEIVHRLHGDLVRVLRAPEVADRFRQEGARPVGNRPEEFGAWIRSEIAKWGKLVRTSGAKLD